MGYEGNYTSTLGRSVKYIRLGRMNLRPLCKTPKSRGYFKKLGYKCLCHKLLKSLKELSKFIMQLLMAKHCPDSPCTTA